MCEIDHNSRQPRVKPNDCERIKNIRKDMHMKSDGDIYDYKETRVDKALQKELNLLNTLIDREIQNGYVEQQSQQDRVKRIKELNKIAEEQFKRKQQRMRQSNQQSEQRIKRGYEKYGQTYM